MCWFLNRFKNKHIENVENLNTSSSFCFFSSYFWMCPKIRFIDSSLTCQPTFFWQVKSEPSFFSKLSSLMRRCQPTFFWQVNQLFLKSEPSFFSKLSSLMRRCQPTFFWQVNQLFWKVNQLFFKIVLFDKTMSINYFSKNFSRFYIFWRPNISFLNVVSSFLAFCLLK